MSKAKLEVGSIYLIIMKDKEEIMGEFELITRGNKYLSVIVWGIRPICRFICTKNIKYIKEV